MTREAIATVTPDRYESTEFRAVSQEEKKRLETRLSWPTNRILAKDAAGVVAVTTAKAAAQATKEQHAQAENLATSETAMSIFGVNSQNCCASAARKDATSSIARARERDDGSRLHRRRRSGERASGRDGRRIRCGVRGEILGLHYPCRWDTRVFAVERRSWEWWGTNPARGGRNVAP